MHIDASIVGHLPETLEVDIKYHLELNLLNFTAIKGDFEMVKLLINRGSESKLMDNRIKDAVLSFMQPEGAILTS